MSNNNLFDTIYVPVKCSERTPQNNAHVFVTIERIQNGKRIIYVDSKRWLENEWLYLQQNEIVTEWLEPLTNRYVFTKEELKSVLIEWDLYKSQVTNEIPFGNMKGEISIDEFIKSQQ